MMVLTRFVIAIFYDCIKSCKKNGKWYASGSYVTECYHNFFITV